MTDGVHQNGATVKNVKRYQPVKNACAVTKFSQSQNTAVLDFFVVKFNCVGNHFLGEFFSEIS